MPTISALFETRREAELAVEHLVQEQEIDRDAIVIGTEGDENTAGEGIDGSDNMTVLENDEKQDGDGAALNGGVVVSVSVDSEDDAEAVSDILHEFSGANVAQEG